MTTIPVLIHRERHATGSDGNALSIREEVTITIVDPSTGQNTGVEAPGFEKTSVLLKLQNKTREYLAGTEGGRSGSLSFPFNVDLFVKTPRQPGARWG